VTNTLAYSTAVSITGANSLAVQLSRMFDTCKIRKVSPGKKDFGDMFNFYSSFSIPPGLYYVAFTVPIKKVV